MAKHGMAPVNMAGVMLNVVLMLTFPLSLFNRPHPEKEKKFFNCLTKDLYFTPPQIELFQTFETVA
jgi:hypothetical protein